MAYDAYRKQSSFLMERWLDFTEFFSLGVLHDLPWDTVGDNIKKGDDHEDAATKKQRLKEEASGIRQTFEQMWALLRSSVLYFMRYEDCQHTEDQIMQAQCDLLSYGALAEKVRPGTTTGTDSVYCESVCFCHTRDHGGLLNIVPPECVATVGHPPVSVRRPLVQLPRYTATLKPCMQVFKGTRLCTIKLHVAGTHLPDQVRACGASSLFLEYWVERLVQLLKRLIKYRSTSCPEMLFVNGFLLVRACRQMLLQKGGDALMEMEAAVAHAKKLRQQRRRRRRALPADVPSGCGFEGAASELEPAEWAAVLPSYAGEGPVPGLPAVLENAPDLEQDSRWPTHPDEPDLDKRRAAIVRELGLSCEGEDPCEGLAVHLCKFKRATLESGDRVSCLQNHSQPRKDDTWCLVHYLEPGRAGRLKSVPYVGRFQFFVQAVIRTENGLHCPARLAVANADADLPDFASDPLPLAVVSLYRCSLPRTPGLRQSGPTRAPEFIRVEDIGTGSSEGASHAGTWLVLLWNIDCQLIPMKPVGKSRYFMSQNKSSGRSRAVRSTFKPVPLVA